MTKIITIEKYYNKEICKLLEINENSALYKVDVTEVGNNDGTKHSKYCVGGRDALKNKSEVQDYIKLIKQKYSHSSFETRIDFTSWENNNV